MENAEHTPDGFHRWEVDALKDFLSKQALKFERNKATLVAHAFAACILLEMQVSISKSSYSELKYLRRI